MKYAFVMMVKEKWWIRFRERHHEGKEVHSYVMRGAAPPKDAKVLMFYVTNPVKAVCGYAEFVERILGSLDEVWNQYGSESVLKTRKSFE